MSLHRSSILIPAKLQSSPYKEWLSSAKRAEDYFRAAQSLSTFPPSWIMWADVVARRASKRGYNVADPLGFRTAALWKGIVLLQEVKFLCDSLECGLRLGVHRHSIAQDIPLALVYTAEWDRARVNLQKERGIVLKLDAPIPETLLDELTFFQLTKLIGNHWKRVMGGAVSKPGFRNLFWQKRECRDKSLFVRDMTSIRDTRNRIAHAKKLFEEFEVRRVFLRTERWLSAVDTGLAPKIERYRQSRPNFLAEVQLSDLSRRNRHRR